MSNETSSRMTVLVRKVSAVAIGWLEEGVPVSLLEQLMADATKNRRDSERIARGLSLDTSTPFLR